MLCSMDLVDAKYIGLISSRLEKFKRVKDNLYNFRCPICGDSQRQKNKARGYLYTVKADINFKCHNCGASMTFSTFLKSVDPVCHKSYIFERFKFYKKKHNIKATILNDTYKLYRFLFNMFSIGHRPVFIFFIYSCHFKSSKGKTLI